MDWINWFITKIQNKRKRKLITELDLILSTHLKVDYNEFFEMLNRKWGYKDLTGEHGDRMIFEFSDLTVEELEQLIDRYGVMRLTR